MKTFLGSTLLHCVDVFSLQDLPPAENHTVTPYAERNLLNCCSYQAANRKHVDWESKSEAELTPPCSAACIIYIDINVIFIF